jgi:hypothetical protein
LNKLDGLELKPIIKEKFKKLKKDYEIDKLVESTKEEYFKRIEAERELKMAAAKMLQGQQKQITEQYDNFIEHMEKDFDGFINYVYEIKKNREVGHPNEIGDIDLYQWKKSLQEKEEERLRLLEEALNGYENKQKYMLNTEVLSAKNQVYKTVISPPNMTNVLDKTGKYHTAAPEFDPRLQKRTPGVEITPEMIAQEEEKQRELSLKSLFNEYDNQKGFAPLALGDRIRERPPPIEVPPPGDHPSPFPEPTNQPHSPIEEQKVVESPQNKKSKKKKKKGKKGAPQDHPEEENQGKKRKSKGCLIF